MELSIIIPTFNAENCLDPLLAKLKTQDNVEFELLIVDSSSSDRTVEIAAKYTDKIIVIPQNEFDHGGTRAMAAEIAQGDILVYMTQDACPYNNDSIKNLIQVFEDKKIGATYGRQVAYAKTSPFGKHLREFNYPKESYVRRKIDKDIFGIKTAQLSNSFAAYRKDVLMSVGGFKDGLILGEDVDAGAKILGAGYSLAYCADAIVYHSHSYTILQEFRRYFDIGVFHQCESWIIQEYGKAEGEGSKYVRSEFKYLIKHKKYSLFLVFFIRNSMKYLGYKLGWNYKKLPKSIIQKMSMHYRWWDNQKNA